VFVAAAGIVIPAVVAALARCILLFHKVLTFESLSTRTASSLTDAGWSA
jgi:hypothetical protein